jgi:hypothetical protein
MLRFVKSPKGKLLVGLSILFVAQAANATLVSGDFRTESDLPDLSVGPLVYQSLEQIIGAGYELDSGDYLQNPSNWVGGVVWMDYNPTTNILTLASQDTGDFQAFDAWITNISFDLAGEYISDISLLSNGLTDPSFAPSLSFTNDSLHVGYDYIPDFFLFTGGIATFQIETQTSAIPEPGSLALLSLGLAGLGCCRRNARA